MQKNWEGRRTSAEQLWKPIWSLDDDQDSPACLGLFLVLVHPGKNSSSRCQHQGKSRHYWKWQGCESCPYTNILTWNHIKGLKSKSHCSSCPLVINGENVKLWSKDSPKEILKDAKERPRSLCSLLIKLLKSLNHFLKFSWTKPQAFG